MSQGGGADSGQLLWSESHVAAVQRGAPLEPLDPANRNSMNHRRRIKTKEEAKVVALMFGGKNLLFNSLAVLLF